MFIIPPEPCDARCEKHNCWYPSAERCQECQRAEYLQTVGHTLPSPVSDVPVDGQQVFENFTAAAGQPSVTPEVTPEEIRRCQKHSYNWIVGKGEPCPKCAVSVGLPSTAQARKERPIARGVLDYFPDALAEIAFVSFKANEQHNPGEPMHWAKGKSTDHADCLLRHLIQRGTRDDDGLLHTAKAAWRALALLQTEIEKLKEASR